MLGILGGSGVYDINGLKNTRWVRVGSPFGEPSDDLLFGELAGQPLAFLPRHGRGHRIPPSEINYRANIDALKRAGVTQLVSVSAVGSLREHLPRIFDPYFSTRRSGGLGLATVYSIVKKHRGFVDVQSPPGTGTTFRIWLPAAEPLAPAVVAEQTARIVTDVRPTRTRKHLRGQARP